MTGVGGEVRQPCMCDQNSEHRVMPPCWDIMYIRTRTMKATTPLPPSRYAALYRLHDGTSDSRISVEKSKSSYGL